MYNIKTPRAIINYIVFVLFKRKLLILGVFLFTLLSFAFGTYLITPQWEAITKILVRPNLRQQTILFKDLAAPGPASQDTSKYDLLEILTSNTFGAEIVKQFKLDESLQQRIQNPQILRDKIKLFMVEVITSPIILATRIGLLEEGEPNFFAKALEDLLEDMEDIEVREGTSTIDISIWAGPPDLAVGIANTLAQMLIEKTNEFEQAEAGATYGSLNNQLQSATESLRKAENELVAFKEQAQIVDLALDKSLKLQRYDMLRAELESTKMNLLARQAKLREIQQQLSSQPEKLTASEVIGVNEIYNRLKHSLNEAEIALANRQEDLGHKHPDIVGLKAMIEQNRLKLQQEHQRMLLHESKTLNEVYQDLLKQMIDGQTSISEMTSKKESLQLTTTRLSQELNAIAQKEVILERLNRSVIGLKDRYVTLRDKSLELEVQRYTTVSEFDIKISDPAFILKGVSPDWPMWPLNLLVGMVFGLILGVGSAFFREYWSDSLESPMDVEEATGLRVLGTVPSVSLGKVEVLQNDFKI